MALQQRKLRPVLNCETTAQSLLLILSRMTFDTLKHRYIAQVNRVLKRLVSFVAGFAFAIGEAAEVDRMLNRQRLENGCRTGRIGQYRMTDAAIFGDDLAGIADVLAVVTAETA
jgi:hypothetical protein